MTGEHADAAAWLARLRAEHRTAEDVAAFRAWLSRDPDNAARFEHLTDTWEHVGGLVDIERTPLRSTAMSRRTVLAGGAGLAVAAGAGAWAVALPDAAYATEIGERRTLTLDDGSRLLLNTGTELDVRLTRKRRIIRLKHGQVLVDVAVDPRPFLIQLADRTLLASQGRFDIRTDDEAEAFFAVDGAAQIAMDASGSVSLSKGDRLRAWRTRAPAIDRPDASDLLAWQDGRAVFRDTRLVDAVREMNRYSKQPLRLASASLGEQRLSGVYRVGDNAAFAKALAMLFRVRSTGSEREIMIEPSGP